jgi:hypothetical protein
VLLKVIARILLTSRTRVDDLAVVRVEEVRLKVLVSSITLYSALVDREEVVRADRLSIYNPILEIVSYYYATTIVDLPKGPPSPRYLGGE